MKLVILSTAALCCLVAGQAEARVHHAHRAHFHHRHHHGFARATTPRYPVTIGYGDTIISGRTGLHRSDWGKMVPDGTAPNFVLTGRRSGSGLGANGLPGSNLDE